MSTIRRSFSEVGFALRQPVRFSQERSASLSLPAFAGLLMTAVLGIGAYGLTFGIGQGPMVMLGTAGRAVLAAGLAWTICLPALYVIASYEGSPLSAQAVVTSALVTVSFGGLALLASVPVTLFLLDQIQAAGLGGGFRTAVHAVVYTGVGFSMADVFLRSWKGLDERPRWAPFLWLALMAVVGFELFSAFRLFGGAR